MSLIQITESSHPIILDLVYATERNFVGAPVYDEPLCFLHKEAVPLLDKAIGLAAKQNLKLKIFDAFRPQAAAERFWEVCPNPMYVADPAKGSHHTRGIAIDLTLTDTSGTELDMGTPFDNFEETSHHGNMLISEEAQANRYMLLGIMMSAGWDFF